MLLLSRATPQTSSRCSQTLRHNPRDAINKRQPDTPYGLDRLISWEGIRWREIFTRWPDQVTQDGIVAVSKEMEDGVYEVQEGTGVHHADLPR